MTKHLDCDNFVISFPKSGRSWARFALMRYLANCQGASFDPKKDVNDYAKGLPRLAFGHDGTSHIPINFTADEWPADQSVYAEKRVLFMVRDMRDTMVSYFYHCTEREKAFNGDMSIFLRDPRFGIAKPVRFLNRWVDARHKVRDFMVSRYEDMQDNPAGELLRMAQFLGYPVNNPAAEEAAKFSSFESMKNLERSGALAIKGRFGAGVIWRPAVFVIVLALCALGLVFNRRLRLRRGGRWLRVTVVVTMLLLCWGIAGVGFNYYTNEAYFLDRLLILSLALLSIRFPGLSVLTVAYCMLFLGQLSLSAGDMETTDKLLLLYAGFAVVSWLLLRTLFPMRSRTLLHFMLVLAGVAYFAPGWAKLNVTGSFDPTAWLVNDPLHCFMVTAHAHGWLGWMGNERVAGLASMISGFAPLMALFTLLVEVGAPMFVLFRRGAIAFLALAIAMHMGIFVMTGIFFWKWMALDGVMIAWLFSMRRPSGLNSNWRRVSAMALLFVCIPLYTSPKFLGWLDSNNSEGYFFEVVTADGQTYRVNQKDFGPYDITFEQGAFHYVNRDPVLNDLWGNAPWEVGLETAELTEPADARDLVQKHGKVHLHAKKQAELDRFLLRFFTHVNERSDSMQWLHWFGPPHHMQVHSGEPAYDFKQPVTRVKMRFYRTFFDGYNIHVLDDRIVHTVEISGR